MIDSYNYIIVAIYDDIKKSIRKDNKKMNKHFSRFMQRLKEENIPLDDRKILLKIYVRELYKKGE